MAVAGLGAEVKYQAISQRSWWLIGAGIATSIAFLAHPSFFVLLLVLALFLLATLLATP